MSAVLSESLVESSSAHDVLPRRFGPYTLFEPVGRGGMAELFLARAETGLGATRRVVVKLILPAFADDLRFAEMLIHEAKLASKLNHAHIVQVTDLGKDENHLYIAMEYVEGLDLNALLRLCSQRKEGLPAQHALGIVADILAGLHYAHRRTSESGEPLGIVHRDVSPSNILISYDGEVKLCDFGIAHANDLVRGEGIGEALKGKAGYMSPEHARGEVLDARSDVFAAGIILWELLAGRRLYSSRSGVPLLEQARGAEIPALLDKGLSDHEELERIVRRALAADREERYPSAGAFQRDLDAYMTKAGLLSSRLKLGEWITATFGTDIVEVRRASERRLPPSAQPPRPSGIVRTGLGIATLGLPQAPLVPADLAIAVTQEESLPLFVGVSLVGTTGLDHASPVAPHGLDRSLPGTTLDIEPSSSQVSSPETKGSAANANASSPEADAELIAWARKRGYVSFLFFFLIAVAVGAGWFLTR